MGPQVRILPPPHKNDLIMLFLLFYLLPIIVIGFIVYCNMEHGQTLKEYVKVNDFAMPALFTWIPIFNWLILLVAIGAIIWHYISNFKKP